MASVETYGGICPNCTHTPMVQRYEEGMGNATYQLDACPNCGFGYGEVGGEEDSRGVDAWFGWYLHMYLMATAQNFVGDAESLRFWVYNHTKNETPDPHAPKTVFQYPTEEAVADCVFPKGMPRFSQSPEQPVNSVWQTLRKQTELLIGNEKTDFFRFHKMWLQVVTNAGRAATVHGVRLVLVPGQDAPVVRLVVAGDDGADQELRAGNINPEQVQVVVNAIEHYYREPLYHYRRDALEALAAKLGVETQGV